MVPISAHPKVVLFPVTEAIDPQDGAVVLAAKERSMVMKPDEFNETEIELQVNEGGMISSTEMVEIQLLERLKLSVAVMLT